MKILVALDLSEHSETVVHKAAELAQSLAASVCILHAAEPDPDFVGYDVGPQTRRDALSEKYHEEHRRLQEIARHFRDAEVETVALLVQGPTVDTILHEAEKFEADMIVMGSHGKNPLKQLLLGSVSEGVLHQSTCPVCVVPTRKK